MISAISQGVIISVDVMYQKDFSNPMESAFLFAYRITIKNTNSFPIQLLSRHWLIFDSDYSFKEVKGDGVVGQQPIIQPNQQYSYTSTCGLNTEMGKMQGTYTMINLYTHTKFEAKIPNFNLVYPHKYN
jgi:ApaG protein